MEVPSAGDNATVRREQVGRERERVPDSQIELEVQLSGEGQQEE